MKAYILIIGVERTRKEYQQFLDSIPEVAHWCACMPNSIFFSSSLSAADLVTRMEAVFPSQGTTYLIMEVGAERQGWLPQAAWEVIRNFNSSERSGVLGAQASVETIEDKLNATRKYLQDQITEVRTYAHDEIHGLTGDFAGFRGLHEARSEGVQNRINALMELFYHMRGQFDQVLAEQRAIAAPTQLAAVTTETRK